MSDEIVESKKQGARYFIPLLTFLAIYLGAGIIFSIWGVETPFKQISREFALLCGVLVNDPTQSEQVCGTCPFG